MMDAVTLNADAINNSISQQRNGSCIQKALQEFSDSLNNLDQKKKYCMRETVVAFDLED